jgi:hypothetical protein
MAKNVTNKHTHVIAEYPKWVDGVLYQNEEKESDDVNKAERDRMVKVLNEDYGKKVDLRQHKTFGSILAYYEAVTSREAPNGDSGDDS